MRLTGKVALITGGARGIGRAIGEGYAREGAKVCLADLDGAEAARAAKEIGQGAVGIVLDVTRQESIDAAVAQLPNIDILVNNAAIFDLAPLEEITERSYDRIFAVNVKGLLFMMQAVARQMLDRDMKLAGHRGKIINMASQAGRRGEALVGVYCASKAAVISLTQSAGLGLARHGINVNAISPGVVDTPMWHEVDALFAKYENRPKGEKKKLVGEAVPFGRMGTPEDHVGAAIFLASPDSDYIVAQTYNVDGGNWMS